MENCSICFRKLKFSNTPLFNSGKLADGIICTKCFKRINNIDPSIISKLKNIQTSDIKILLSNQHASKNGFTKDAAKGCAVIIAIVIITVIIIGMCTSGNKEKKESYTKNDALIEVRQFVEKRLKSPGSAKWSSDYNNEVSQVNDSTFIINSWVDSQNSFGALMRSEFSCKLIYLPSIKQVRCEDLIIR